MSKVISVVLNQILSEARSRFTAQEVAEVCEVSTSMISKVKNDEAELSMNRIRRLAQFLSRHGDQRLAQCFVAPGFEIVPRHEALANGCLHDEMADMVRALGRSIEAHDAGDSDALARHIEDLECILERMKAERDRL